MPLDKTQVKLNISLISPIKHNFAGTRKNRFNEQLGRRTTTNVFIGS